MKVKARKRGKVKATKKQATLAGQMKVAERVMRKDRHVLRKLAES